MSAISCLFRFEPLKIIHTIHLFRKISYKNTQQYQKGFPIMFVFLAIFIVFLLYINFLMHKNKRAQENLEKQFWDREHSAISHAKKISAILIILS